jgi:acyl-CoA thioester hydrolase
MAQLNQMNGPRYRVQSRAVTETKRPQKKTPFLPSPPVVERLQVRYADLDTYGHVNNAVHLAYFEAARIAYMSTLARAAGLDPSGGQWDVGGAEFLIAEATVRYKAPIRLGDDLRCGISIRSISRRAFVWDYDLRAGETYEGGQPLAEGTTAQVFYDLEMGASRGRPDWFLPAVASLEGRPEESFAPEPR